jgi:hypothetical protein
LRSSRRRLRASETVCDRHAGRSPPSPLSPSSRRDRRRAQLISSWEQSDVDLDLDLGAPPSPPPPRREDANSDGAFRRPSEPAGGGGSWRDARERGLRSAPSWKTSQLESPFSQLESPGAAARGGATTQVYRAPDPRPGGDDGGARERLMDAVEGGQ